MSNKTTGHLLYFPPFRNGQYKFLLGFPGGLNGWYIPPELKNTVPFELTLEEFTPKMPPSYEFCFPEEWDRFLYDLEGESAYL